MVKKNIPVIFYSSQAAEWEAVDKDSELSRAAAIYKNQLEQNERQSLYVTDDTGDLHAFRSERRRAAMVETSKKKKGGLPKGFMFYMLIAAAFFLLWMFVQQ